jgi:hypothetical protein
MRDQEVTHTAIATAPRAEGADGRPEPGRRAGTDPLLQVRATDVEPYTGLGYLSKLFRIIAVLLVVLMLVEVGTGFYQSGREAIPTLLSEASRLVVLAGLLWGVGDLANLLIDVGHDVRATRILIGRQTAAYVGDGPVDPRERLAREPRANGARAELLSRPELDDRAG